MFYGNVLNARLREKIVYYHKPFMQERDSSMNTKRSTNEYLLGITASQTTELSCPKGSCDAPSSPRSCLLKGK